ncbi:hypothetical protein QVD99_008110 [Batrachochytrium dendrobatidis]|nr:hypothetical protein O5D80_004739 [Batrachochytrium dendrobatidis]KAK5665270.1 hypothetical protein QVD99_008110 [Batrachochytrium dendrobatidis]
MAASAWNDALPPSSSKTMVDAFIDRDGLDDGPPPLEDMTHLFNKLSMNSDHCPVQVSSQHNTTNSNYLASAAKKQNAQTIKSVSNISGSICKPPTPASDKEFNGLKKGFFALAKSKAPTIKTDVSRTNKPSQSISPPTSKKLDTASKLENTESDMPFIRATPKQSSGSHAAHVPFNSHLTDSIQEMFKVDAGANGATPAWMTNAFWERVRQSPNLAKAFADPMFSQAAQNLVTSPQETFEKYVKERPDFLLALKELAAIIGDHLISFAKEGAAVTDNSTTIKHKVEEQSVAVKPSIPNDLPEHEKRIIERVLNDPEIQSILRDPQIQTILSQIQHNPPEITQIMQRAPTKIISKLQKLVECGLLQVQR